jgi:flagellar FliL protein
MSDTPVASPSAPQSSESKLLLILSVVNLLAVLALGAVVFLAFKKEQTKPQVEDIQPTEARARTSGKEGEKHAEANPKKTADYGKMAALEGFIVNLSNPGSSSPKFVRVSISLQLSNAESDSEVTQKMPQVRNTIIDLVNSKRASDLATVEGREQLREEIRNALNGFMISGKVKEVFFTNFAVTS